MPLTRANPPSWGKLTRSPSTPPASTPGLVQPGRASLLLAGAKPTVGLSGSRSLQPTGASILLTADSPDVVNGGYRVPELPRVTVDSAYTAPTGSTIIVAEGGNLQAALDTAQRGDVIQLAAGATFAGNFVVPVKAGTGVILIRSSGYASLPAEGTRATPSHAPYMAKIVSANADPALAFHDNVAYWRLLGIEVSNTSTLSYSLVDVSPVSATATSAYPHHIIIDRCYIHGTDDLEFQRGVKLNGATCAVVDSTISECHASGVEAQAIIVYDTPGPIKISNCKLEGSAQCFMVGGAGTLVAGLVPEDFEFVYNHCYKPPEWDGVWSVKNSFEIKNVRRMLVEGNVFENCWADAQTGTAIVLKSNGENCEQAVMEDVTFRYNIIENTPKGITVVGVQENYYPHTYEEPINARVAITHNLLLNVGSLAYGDATNEWIFTPMHGGIDITFDHNTVATGDTSALMMFSAATGEEGTRFYFTNNLATLGDYGIRGDGSLSAATGSAALEAFYPGYTCAGNVLGLDGGNSALYPAGNYWPATRAAIGLVGYKLPGGSPYLGVATDGTDPGADIDTVMTKTQGVAESGLRPGTAALTLTGNQPSVRYSKQARPGTAALTLTGKQVVVVQTGAQRVTPGTASLLLTGYPMRTGATIRTVTVKSAGGTYGNLKSAISGEAANLVSLDRQLTIECYAFEDTSYIEASDFTGYTTDATHYIDIVVPAAERHNGTASTGYYLKNTANTAILSCNGMSGMFLRFRGVAFNCARNTTYNGGPIFTSSTSSSITLEDCLILRTSATAPDETYGFIANAMTGSTVRVRNTIIAGWSGYAGLVVGSANTVVLYNNTVVQNGAAAGFSVNYNSHTYLSNNVGQNTGAGAAFSLVDNADTHFATNLSDDTSAPVGTEVTGATLTFANAAGQDYHLAATDSAAIGAGTDLSADATWPFSTDIDGDTRSDWDIGADEY